MTKAIYTFSCDLNSKPEGFPHFWEHTVGSGHATLALRADWQKQLTRCRQELGFRHVRFHGILSDDMGTFREENKEIKGSFFNADQICDFLLSIGMRPFVELSFMPQALASGSETVFHYRGNITPPKDFSKWQQAILDLLTHWQERYGAAEVQKWFFEVWNEPNLKAFWTGTQADYFQLYKVTAEAIKKISTDLQVGGPATAKNAWIADFIKFCEDQHVPLDFISTHHYPTDAFGKPGDDTVAKLAESHRSVLREETQNVFNQAKGHPIYYTEWCTSSNPFDGLHDQSYAAAFIVKTVMEARGLVRGYSYWTFSDIFEENYFSSKPFHGGFGLLNVYGIPKPSYRAFELLHHLGDEILSVKGTHPTVDTWVTRSGKSMKVLMSNWALPEHEIQTEFIDLQFTGSKILNSAYVESIDLKNSNSHTEWQDMGEPSSLTPAEVNQLEMVSRLKRKPVSFELDGQNAHFRLSLEPQSVQVLSFEVE